MSWPVLFTHRIDARTLLLLLSQSENDHDNDHCGIQETAAASTTDAGSVIPELKSPNPSSRAPRCQHGKPSCGLMPTTCQKLPKITVSADHTAAGCTEDDCGEPCVSVRECCYVMLFQIHHSMNKDPKTQITSLTIVLKTLNFTRNLTFEVTYC